MLIHEILKFNMSCSSKKVKRSTKISGCYMTDHHHQSDLILNTNKLTEVHINISHRNVFDAPKVPPDLTWCVRMHIFKHFNFFNI